MDYQNITKLASGTLAPSFEAQDIFGNSINLKNYAGKFVLLSFFRNAACAICNLRVHKLIQKYPAYQKQGLEIIAVFESPRENMLQYVAKQDAPFPLITNPDATLYNLYGVETSQEKLNATLAWETGKAIVAEAASLGFQLTPEEGSNFLRMPADFLIDPNGHIRHAFYSDLVGEHLPFETIEQALVV